jgi:hypothetical protein
MKGFHDLMAAVGYENVAVLVLQPKPLSVPQTGYKRGF